MYKYQIYYRSLKIVYLSVLKASQPKSWNVRSWNLSMIIFENFCILYEIFISRNIAILEFAAIDSHLTTKNLIKKRTIIVY